MQQEAKEKSQQDLNDKDHIITDLRTQLHEAKETAMVLRIRHEEQV
jgi:hypothetical protein